MSQRRFKRPKTYQRMGSEAARMRKIALSIKTPGDLEITLRGLTVVQRKAVIELIREYLPFEPSVEPVTP